jgi:hypothetical protein
MGSGGALYIDNVKRMLISNTEFRLNVASKNGGGLILICEEQTYDCKLDIKSSYFVENRIGESGGAIYWAQVEPTITGVTYDRNYAGIYAHNIGCIPAKLVAMNESEYMRQLKRAGGARRL